MMPFPHTSRACTIPCLTALATLLALLAMPGAPAFAHSYKLGTLEIIHPWTRATPKGAKVAGGYVTLTNRGSAPDRLVAVETPTARTTELHEMKEEHGIMKMRALAQGIAIPAVATVTLAPGGLHVMFMEIAAPLKQGESVPARLIFEKAGTIDVVFRIEAMGARGNGKDGHKGH
jgi:copper(I)-binding protein